MTKHNHHVAAEGFCVTDGTPSSPPEEEQIEQCMAWLRVHAQPTEYIDDGVSSYGFKHRVERWLNADGYRSYISNGAFIMAAQRAGYTARRIPGTPNAYFNIRILNVDDEAP